MLFRLSNCSKGILIGNTSRWVRSSYVTLMHKYNTPKQQVSNTEGTAGKSGQWLGTISYKLFIRSY